MWAGCPTAGDSPHVRALCLASTVSTQERGAGACTPLHGNPTHMHVPPTLGAPARHPKRPPLCMNNPTGLITLTPMGPSTHSWA